MPPQVNALRKNPESLVDAYNRQGFVKLDYSIDPRRIEAVAEAVDRLSDPDTCAKNLHNPDYLFETDCDADSLFKIRNLFAKDPVFIQLALSFAQCDVVRALTEGVPRFGVQQLVLKRRGGKRYAWHRDDEADSVAPGFNVGVYLDHSSVDNGCLEVAPGSHRLSGRNRDVGAEPSGLALEMRRGAVLIHSTHLIHRSGVNRTGDIRRVVYFDIRTLAQDRTRPRAFDVGIQTVSPDWLRQAMVGKH